MLFSADKKLMLVFPHTRVSLGETAHLEVQERLGRT
jgi:hypothetical protein